MRQPLIQTEILVSHHKPENEPYLDLALESLQRQSVKPLVTIISSTELSANIENKYFWKDTGFNFITDPSLDNASKKVDYFLDHLKPTTKYVSMMSNDVYLSTDVVKEMEHAFENMTRPVILSPLSNNESGTRFTSHSPFPSPNYSIDDVNLITLRTWNPKHGIFFRVPWISFYCPFIPVEVLTTVGRFDPQLDSSHNDVDYCLRAAYKGICTYINGNAFALHFGSKTLQDGRQRDKEVQYFESKHSILEILKCII